MDGEEFVEEHSAGFKGERAEAGLARAADFAAEFGVFGDGFEAVAEVGEGEQFLVPSGDEGFDGVVLFYDGAGPAAEAGGVAAAGGGVVFADDEGTFAAEGVFVEGDDVVVGAAPCGLGLQEGEPDFVGGEFYDGRIDPDAFVVGVRGETAFGFKLVFGDAGGAGRGFGAAGAE